MSTELLDLYTTHVGETVTLAAEENGTTSATVDATLTAVEAMGGDAFIVTVAAPAHGPTEQGTYVVTMSGEQHHVFLVPGSRSATGTIFYATYSVAPTESATPAREHAS